MNTVLNQVVYRNKKRNAEFNTQPKHGDSGWVCNEGTMIEMKYISDNLYTGWITTEDFRTKTKESSKVRAMNYLRVGGKSWKIRKTKATMAFFHFYGLYA